MMPKFRAWVKPGVLSNHLDGVIAEAKPDYIERVCLVKRDDLIENECFDEIFDFDDVILMQSTGLKDKNGVEIFVGDIVKGEQWLTTTMLSQTVEQVSYSERNTMFYLGGANESHDRFMHSLGNTIYQYEVVGNIYANPELLSSGIE